MWSVTSRGRDPTGLWTLTGRAMVGVRVRACVRRLVRVRLVACEHERLQLTVKSRQPEVISAPRHLLHLTRRPASIPDPISRHGRGRRQGRDGCHGGAGGVPR